MSRIADRLINISMLNDLTFDNNDLFFSIKEEKYHYKFPSFISLKRSGSAFLQMIYNKNRKLIVEQAGLHNALVTNFIQGLVIGFTKRLSITGVGYKVLVKNDFLILQVGFSHFIRFKIPKCLSLVILDGSGKKGQFLLDVKGSDKALIGLFASQVKRSFPVEPYKLKGIKLVDDFVMQKSGKSNK